MRSIRNQLVFSLAAGVVLLTAAAGVGLYAYMEEVLEHGLDVALAARADAIAGAVHMEDDGRPHLQPMDATAVHRDGPFYYQVWRADGATLARFAPPDAGTGPLPGPARPGRRFADAVLPDGTAARVTRLSFVAQPDADEFDPPPARPAAAPRERLTVVVAHDRRSIEGPLAVLLTGLSFAAAVVIAGLLGLVTWGVRRGLRPLADVSRLADRIGPATLGVRFPADDAVPVELRPIATKLNDLLDRLQAGFDRERRFAAAVAHELRTPVSELRSLCEVTLRWPGDGRAATDAVADALDIAKEMGTAVENLILLARCQAGVEQLRVETVCLSAAVGDQWDRCRARAAERTLEVEVDVAHPCPVRADPRAVAVILRNLMENAVEHATAGGRVRVRAGRVNDRATLVIGNSAAGLDAADLPHLTEAFWRKDAARTSRTHVGMGLAIVDAYCRVAHLDFGTHLYAGDWFEVTVTLPSGS